MKLTKFEKALLLQFFPPLTPQALREMANDPREQESLTEMLLTARDEVRWAARKYADLKASK